MIEFFVRRRVATVMMFAAVLLLGVISLSRLKVSLFPDISFPRLTVLTPYSNVGPEEIENLVTRPIEDAVSSVNGVKKIVSRSQEGLSIVEVSLEWGGSLDLAVINLRQKVDLARSVLPQDTGKSIIIKFDPSADPIVLLTARPVNTSFEDLRDHVDKNVRPFLERIPGVASVQILGGYRREIQVNVDSGRLFGYGLTLDRLAQSLSSSNFNFPAGNVRRGAREYNVRVMGQFDAVRDIESAVVSVGENGAPVYVSQVAEVRDGFRERRGSAYYNQEPAVIVGVRKEPDQNAIETADAIREALVDINRRFERSVQFEVIQDRSIFVSDSIRSVRNDAFLGGAIAFVVLFFFLKDLRAAVIVIVTIPFSVISTFALMYLQDVSLNIMSLGGLALGTGLMIDNSIVTLEAIYQEAEHYPERDWRDNAINGARAVFGSVTASTLTSIVVFVPIIFVSGVAGAVFRDLALTVSFSSIASYFCSMTVIPMLASLSLRPGSRAERWLFKINSLAAPAFALTDGFVTGLRTQYGAVIRFAVARPGLILGVSFGLSFTGALLLWPVEKRLLPEADLGEVELRTELPGGATLEESERLHASIHEFALKNKLALHAVTRIGFDEDDLASRVEGVRKPNLGETQFILNPDHLSSRRFIEHLSGGLSNLGNVRADFRIKGDALEELLGESADLLYFEVEGRDRAKAREAASWIYERLRRDALFRSLKSSAVARDPEVRVRLDRERLAAFGLTPEGAAGAVRAAVRGQVATLYREGDREIDVRVRLREEDRRTADQLHSLYVSTPSGRNVELGRLIALEDGLSFPVILRENQRRVERIEVGFEPDNRDEAGEKLEALRDEAVAAFAERFRDEDELEVRVREQNSETLESLQSLIYAFILSTILIYQLLAAQFESFLHPFTLTLSIPMILFGVSVSLLITGNSLNITSGIGLVMLTGIVVNNAIVLYEYIQQNREERGLSSDEALPVLTEILEAAGRERVRPILLTTLTTILGVAPMALGLGGGGDMQAPMAVVVMGGLSVGSLLTLVAFPTLYALFERMRVLGIRGALKR